MDPDGRDAEREFRLAEALRRLAGAGDMDTAMRALSLLDMTGLRDVEYAFSNRHPKRLSEEDLRLFLAEQHVARIRGEPMTGTEVVTAQVFARFALDTLREWLPGYTDYDEALGGQFHISYLGRDILGEKYRVETAEKRFGREFRLAVAVLAVDPKEQP